MAETVGNQIEYASKVLLPNRRFDEYFNILDSLLHENLTYIDPVHELKGKDAVLEMLKKYVARVANDKYEFELVQDDPEKVIWKWTIALKIRLTPFEFIIHGLVEAKVRDGKIYYQREYYDPMESIGVIPFVGFLYKCILKMG